MEVSGPSKVLCYQLALFVHAHCSTKIVFGWDTLALPRHLSCPGNMT